MLRVYLIRTAIAVTFTVVGALAHRYFPNGVPLPTPACTCEHCKCCGCGCKGASPCEDGKCCPKKSETPLPSLPPQGDVP